MRPPAFPAAPARRADQPSSTIAPYRPDADALDAGEQLRLSCPAATAVVRHPRDDVADWHGAPLHMRLVDHLHLPAAVALDPQEPGRERAERLVEGLGTGRQWVGAVAEPVSPGRSPGGHYGGHSLHGARPAFSVGCALVVLIFPRLPPSIDECAEQLRHSAPRQSQMVKPTASNIRTLRAPPTGRAAVAPAIVSVSSRAVSRLSAKLCERKSFVRYQTQPRSCQTGFGTSGSFLTEGNPRQ